MNQPNTMPTLRLTWWLLKSISDYSASIPSGTTPGKVWRRRIRYTDPDGPDTKYALGMYGEPDGDKIPIYWFPVMIVEGPERVGLERTDWSNYERWKELRATA